MPTMRMFGDELVEMPPETEADFLAARAADNAAPTITERRATLHAAVNAERDRRLCTPFAFAGYRFDYDDASQKRITGAAALAGFALTMGTAEPGNFRWHGGAADFGWIAADNRLVPMDALTTFGLGQAAAAWESAHVFAARALKERLAAATKASALDAIDITAGWPA